MAKCTEPPYDFELVPRCRRGFEGSVLRRVDSRKTWMQCMTECLLLCNEAAWRRIVLTKKATAKRGGPAAAAHDPKPLMLEYIADRLDTDDPMWGWMVRTKNEEWLQGFITVTTFTTWQPWFRWDSVAVTSGITLDDVRDRRCDLSNRLATELNAQDRAGDPEGASATNIWEMRLR